MARSSVFAIAGLQRVPAGPTDATQVEPPRPRTDKELRDSLSEGEALQLTRSDALQLYRWMRTARRIDEMERELIARGEAFFQVSAAGHEASAVLALLLQPDDYLHCHYRDKALLHARGVPIGEYFASLLCNAASHSAGRQMSAHYSAPALNILSLVGPVGNNALQAVGIACEIKDRSSRPLVLCGLGDGTAQQGEVLEAIAEAVRCEAPVLFLVEDNRYSISTRTQRKTFYSTPAGYAESFYGLPIHRVNGNDPDACLATFHDVVQHVRVTRGPALCLMQVERLTDHTNADDQLVYRAADEVIQAGASGDPLSTLRARLVRHGVGEQQIAVVDDRVDGEVRAAAEAALDEPAPAASRDAKLPLPPALLDRQREYRGESGGDRLTMVAALRETLRVRMRADTRVTLYGEDIEDPKGDVFGVTRGLSSAFPGRVANSPLSESTILGTSIGRALAGGRPVAFIQFADFLPLAFNQLATELASMAWRTDGGWRAPVVVMVTCGGYRPGLGPFHAGSHESIVAHIPGLDVAMPSTAADAAGILNTAFRGERPTVLFYPKALLNDPARTTSPDVARQMVPIGAARVVRNGAHLTLVGWGNTVPLCEKVAVTLASAGVEADLIDLRWLSPWDRATVCASARKTRRLLVVHEDNLTAGFGAEVIAAVSESVTGVACRRVARPDTFVPCHFGNQLEVLPSYRTTLSAAAELCDLELSWTSPPEADVHRQVVTTIGSSPSDQSVGVVDLSVAVGDTVTAGQVIASLEADKAIVDLASPCDGTVEEIHLHVGERAEVDVPLLTLRVARHRRRQPVREEIGIATLKPRASVQGRKRVGEQRIGVLVAGLRAVRGRARLHNADLIDHLPSFRKANGTDGIFERTGIESRVVADHTQDVVSMAAEAATAALAEAGIDTEELGLVICSTATPNMISPSTACQVLHRLAPTAEVAAYDLQAACSGYLYALSAAWDYLQGSPRAKVLVLTSETMRRFVDVDDPDTSPIFADAATATVLTGAIDGVRGLAMLEQPVISARGESGASLNVPLPHAGAYIHMDGRKIFAEAVRRMQGMLEQACERSQITVDALDLIVPHQANGRIIEAIRSRLKLAPERVWNEIRHQGNTSSSSIPLALDTVLHGEPSQRRIGLCAFGAGYTFGAALMNCGGGLVTHDCFGSRRAPQ